MSRFALHLGDCRESMAAMAEASVDAIVTDPPYGLASGPTTTLEEAQGGRGFMGKEWDRGVPGVTFWREALRVAKPGAHMLAFGGTRAFHRMAVAIEDAGWEIRDCVCWLYGSGFPKSLDASKAIDRAAGAEREVVGSLPRPSFSKGRGHGRDEHGQVIYRGINGGHEGTVDLALTAPATDAAKEWAGWGTALKPAWEPVLLCRKPLEGTVAANLLRHGTGALNIDGARVEGVKRSPEFVATLGVRDQSGSISGIKSPRANSDTNQGRWPANLMHDGSPEVVAGFPESNGAPSGKNATPKRNGVLDWRGGVRSTVSHFDIGGSASRFFYCAKASRADREEGCEGLPSRSGADATDREEGTAGLNSPRAGASRTVEAVRNHHPTVKPTELMRYLIRLITPPGGTVLDPFMGSGSTGKAAMLEGARFVGCDLDPDYLAIAEARIRFGLTLEAEEAAAAFEASRQLSLFGDL